MAAVLLTDLKLLLNKTDRNRVRDIEDDGDKPGAFAEALRLATIDEQQRFQTHVRGWMMGTVRDADLDAMVKERIRNACEVIRRRREATEARNTKATAKA